jgi:signal transduction histidine kinase
LDSLLENALFRIVQEAITNARRHSKSTRVWVELTQEDDHFLLTIQDWGKGFSLNQIGDGCYGLEGIRERARLLGGRATIESEPEKGTRIRVELPVRPGETAE